MIYGIIGVLILSGFGSYMFLRARNVYITSHMYENDSHTRYLHWGDKILMLGLMMHTLAIMAATVTVSVYFGG